MKMFGRQCRNIFILWILVLSFIVVSILWNLTQSHKEYFGRKREYMTGMQEYNLEGQEDNNKLEHDDNSGMSNKIGVRVDREGIPDATKETMDNNDLGDATTVHNSNGILDDHDKIKTLGDMNSFDRIMEQKKGDAVRVDEVSEQRTGGNDSMLYVQSDFSQIKKSDLSLKKMNVLFIISDDLRPQISAYRGQFSPNPEADQQVVTPNIDRLARRSLLLTRAYNQFGVCNPSRASFMTGRRPDTVKVWTLTACWRDTGGNFTTIPQFFKERGYETVGLGKVYHQGTSCDNDPPSWTKPFYLPPHQNRWQNDRNSWMSVSQEVRETEPLPDEETTQEAIRLLRDLAPKALTGQKPFFLGVGYHKPHVPFICPQEMHNLYPLQTVKLPNNSFFPKDFPRIAWAPPEVGRFKDMLHYNCSSKVHHEEPCVLPDQAVRLLRKAYFACVSYVDGLVGKLLDEIDRLGLRHSTVISFVSDHGYTLGENGMFGKHTNMEQISHTPMMISIPGKTDHGISSNSIVELVDLFPTLVEASGFEEIPKCPHESSDVKLCQEGSSLMPLIQNPNARKESAAFSQMGRTGSMGYTIRTDRYRYTAWPALYMDKHTQPDGTELFRYRKDWNNLLGVELYDFHSDPEEHKNHATDPENKIVMKNLHEMLKKKISPITYINDWIWYLNKSAFNT